MASRNRETRMMDYLLPIVVLAVWFILGRWVLPRLGVPT